MCEVPNPHPQVIISLIDIRYLINSSDWQLAKGKGGYPGRPVHAPWLPQRCRTPWRDRQSGLELHWDLVLIDALDPCWRRSVLLWPCAKQLQRQPSKERSAPISIALLNYAGRCWVLDHCDTQWPLFCFLVPFGFPPNLLHLKQISPPLFLTRSGELWLKQLVPMLLLGSVKQLGWVVN